MSDLGNETLGAAPQTEAFTPTWAPEVIPFVERPAQQGAITRYFRKDGQEVYQPSENDIRLPEYIKVTTNKIEPGDAQYEEYAREQRVAQSWVTTSKANSREENRRRNDFFYDDEGRLVCVRVVHETTLPISEFSPSTGPTILDEPVEFELFIYNEDGSEVAGATVRRNGQPVNYGRYRYASEGSVAQVFLPPQAGRFSLTY